MTFEQAKEIISGKYPTYFDEDLRRNLIDVGKVVEAARMDEKERLLERIHSRIEGGFRQFKDANLRLMIMMDILIELDEELVKPENMEFRELINDL
jgi:hypothetical protein